MSEKSGIQMIEEILNKMAVLDRRLQVMEHLMKELLGVANSCPTPKVEMNGQQARISAVNQLPERISAAMVTGKIVDEGKPVPKVSITIYDSSNQIVKQTNTNKSGDWMAKLSPGKYSAKCFLEGKVNGNVVFTVNKEDKIVHVQSIS